MTGASSTSATGHPPVRLGLIGCADIALRRVLPAVARLPGVELTAVASREAARAAAVAQRFGGEPVVGYAKLLRRPDVDAVYLPLPTGLHAEWIRRALAAGKHVLAEKPLTTSARETAELVAIARDRGLVLMENYMFVHHSQHATVRRMLEEGVIGELRAFSATFTIPPRPPTDIRYAAELGGGALLDVGGYPVRAAQLFLGGDLVVVGAYLRHDPDVGVNVGGAALLATSDGVTAQVAFGMEHMYTSSYQLHGSAGRILVEHAFTPPAAHRPVVRIDRQDHVEQFVLPGDDQYLAAVAAFVTAVTAGTTETDSATTNQAALIDAIRRAAGHQ
ncbi:MAG TPA: Gfo/Idh/MocA family oxidoreductase [Micromonosporaceae bacterium]